MDNLMDEDDFLNKFNFTGDEKDEKAKTVPYLPKYSQVRANQSLGLSCIPHLGQYGDEYQWLMPCMTMNCFPQDKGHLKKLVLNLLPQDFVQFADNEGTYNQKNILANNTDTEYYIVNYNAVDMCKARMDEYGDRSVMARINIAPHAFLYPRAQGQEIKENVLACIYTSKREQAADIESSQIYQLANLQGANESVNDWGRVPINRSNFLNNSNFMEVWLHPTDQGGMAISPNNGTFQLDMTTPVTSFVLVVYSVQGKKRCGVFQINIITKDFFACESSTALA